MGRLISPPQLEVPTDPLELEVDNVPRRSAHDRALFIQPLVFEFTGSSAEEARTGDINRAEAFAEWYGLVEKYRDFVSEVRILNPVKTWQRLKRTEGTGDLTPPWHLNDILFAANQSLPFPDRKAVMLSKMKRPDRKDEPPHLKVWYRDHGYEVHQMQTLSEKETFEGMGDSIWHPGRRLLWGGVGPRTDESAYEEVAKRLETPVITLDVQHEAVDATVFHLDICFAALNESSVLIIPELFNDEDLEVIGSVWEEVIRCPLDEGSPDTGYACNAHCVDGENILIQKGNEVTIRRLRDAGFAVHPVQTKELINACKGSVFCLKMMLPSD